MDQKRDEILNHALVLFLKFGFKRMTMVDLAKASGVSRPTLYGQYPDKEAVFKALINQRVDDYIAESLKRLKRAKSFEDKLMVPFNIWILEPYEESLKHPEAESLIKEASTLAPHAMQSLWSSFEQSLTTILELESEKKGVSTTPLFAQICSATCRDAKNQGLQLKEIKKLVGAMITMLLRCQY